MNRLFGIVFIMLLTSCNNQSSYINSPLRSKHSKINTISHLIPKNPPFWGNSGKISVFIMNGYE